MSLTKVKQSVYFTTCQRGEKVKRLSEGLITLFACGVSVGDIYYLRTGKHLFCNWSSSCLSFIFPPFNPKASQANKKGHAAPFCGKLFPSTHSAFYVQSIKQQRFTRTVDIPAPSGALAAWQTDRYSLLFRACLEPCASAAPSAHLLTPRDDYFFCHPKQTPPPPPPPFGMWYQKRQEIPTQTNAIHPTPFVLWRGWRPIQNGFKRGKKVIPSAEECKKASAPHTLHNMLSMVVDLCALPEPHSHAVGISLGRSPYVRVFCLHSLYLSMLQSLCYCCPTATT